METLFLIIGIIALVFDLFYLWLASVQLHDSFEYSGITPDFWIISLYTLGIIANGSLVTYFVILPFILQYV